MHLTKEQALADTDFLHRALEERFAYLRARYVDHRALLEDLRRRLPDEVHPLRFGLDLQKVLAHFIDGHAVVAVAPVPKGYTPFLVEACAEKLVAFRPDRTALIDTDRPYLSAIDGVEVGRWVEAASAYVPAGSPQFVRRGALRWLRAVQMLRDDLGQPQRDTVEIVLVDESGGAPLEVSLDVTEEPPQYGLWPRRESGFLGNDIGYLRLSRMRPEAGAEVQTSLERFRHTAALVIDVRGNGGGTRDALLALLPLIMSVGAEPRVVNVAAYRLHTDFQDDHLSARQLYRLESDHWTPHEREVLARFLETFEPEWRPPAEHFSDWHGAVVSPAAPGASVRYDDRQVTVLCDAKCFSATDVFLAALRGLPNVALVGEPSGGGSARAQAIELPACRLRVHLASMASFQASGLLFDGHGVQPDLLVHPDPEFFVQQGRDAVLERALELTRQ